MDTNFTDLIYKIVVVIAALILGSFANAYVYRTRIAETKKGTGKQKKYSIVSGRSICPNCKHELSAMDLVPIFSWIYLRGKCRYCAKPISIQYPIVELLTVFIFLFSYYYWPYRLTDSYSIIFILWLLILTILISLSIFDIKYMLLPNSMIYVLLALSLLFTVSKFALISPYASFVLNSALGLLIGGGIYYLIFQISSGKWIGGGDVKLGALLGLILGSAVNALLMIFISSALGSLIGIFLLFSRKIKRNAHIPYGPLLIISTFILVLFATSIVNKLKTHGIYI